MGSYAHRASVQKGELGLPNTIQCHMAKVLTD